MINAYIQGSYARLDGKLAGIQGESMSRTLRLNFSPEWGELTKRILWLDARGKQVVSQPLVASVDEVLENNGLVISVKIPGEALQYDGKTVFIVEGADENGAISLSVMAEMTVNPNDFYGKNAINATEPTPTEMQQLQATVEEAIGVAAADKQAAQAEANRAATAANAAAKSEAAAEDAAGTAIENANRACTYANQARAAASTAERDALAANGAADKAEAAKAAAQTAQAAAETAKSGAEAAAFTASQEREKAQTARSQAQNAETIAVSAANAAISAKNGTAQDKLAAEQAKTAAVTAKTQAEAARDKAVEAASKSGVPLSNKATVGQMIIVKSVDSKGVPTKWEAVDRTHYEYTKYGEVYFSGPPGIEGPVHPNGIIGDAWWIMETDNELEYVLDGVSYVRPVSGARIGSKEYRYIGNGSLDGFGVNTYEDFCLYVMYDDDTHTTTIDAMYADGTKPNEIFIKEQDEVALKKLDKKFLPNDIGSMVNYNDLQDKPVGVEMGELLPETTVAIDPDTGEGVLQDYLELEVGKQYTVNWNGVAYDCTAVDSPNPEIPSAWLGNLGALGGGESTGEPFIIVALSKEAAETMGVGATVVALDGSSSVTLSIIGVVVKKLDDMYLPERSDPLIVELTFDKYVADPNSSVQLRTYKADKTLDEVKAALEGKPFRMVYLLADDKLYSYCCTNGSNLYFQHFIFGSDADDKHSVSWDAIYWSPYAENEISEVIVYTNFRTK